MGKEALASALRDVLWYGGCQAWRAEFLVEQKLAVEKGRYLVLTDEGWNELRNLFLGGY